MSDTSYCIIHFFKGMGERNGTDVDAANIMKVFRELGFKTVIHNDQKVSQIKQLLKSGFINYFILYI